MNPRVPKLERLRQLRMAILRIEKGRARIADGRKLSVVTVAIEAGVSPALIHNSYPEIAEEIREKLGRSSRSQRDAFRVEVKNLEKTNSELRATIREQREQIAKLASVVARFETERAAGTRPRNVWAFPPTEEVLALPTDD